MNELAGIDKFIWGLTALAQLVLFVSLLVRKDHREFPAFFFYISTNLLQAVIAYVSYHIWPYGSVIPYWIVWGSQAIVLATRAVAVTEICRHQLGRYRGIWELIWRVLFLCVGIILVYASIASRHDWYMLLPNLRRSIELAIATGIVGLFLFARYYEIVSEPLLRSLALGFLLISCFAVLNASILERLNNRYAPLWTILDVLSFFASLLIWTWALRQPRTATAQQTLSTGDLYKTLGPEVNVRLRLLNEQLSRFLKVEADRS